MIRFSVAIVAVLAFFALAIPAMAQPPTEGGDAVCLHVQIDPIGEYTIENYFNDVVIDDCDDFADSYNLGYILYGVCTNMPWQLYGHWEYSCDEEANEPFPLDWQIWSSDDGVTGWLPLTTSETPDLLDSGDCDQFEGRDWHFALTGPDVCDEPGDYYGELEVFLGAF